MISLKIKYVVKVFLAMTASDMHRISVLGRIWDTSSYNKQSPNFSGSNFFLAHMRGSSSPHGSSPVVTQDPGSSCALSIPHGLRSCHWMERKGMGEHTDEFMVKFFSGMQYVCPHFIGQNLIIWAQSNCKWGLEVQSSSMPRKINKTDVHLVNLIHR